MIPLAGAAVLTAARMKEAEAASGVDLADLMRRAGEGIAAAVHRLAAGAEVLVLCGTGNNGGDGWVAAASLARGGLPVRVAALGEPATDLARAARAGWSGPVETLADAAPAPVLVDALFGTGLSRALPESAQAALVRLAGAARLRIAVDVPSGVASDDGAVFGRVPRFDLTLALGAAKPVHIVQPGARYCGTVRLIDLGIAMPSDVHVLARPDLPRPGPDAYKFSRGMVAVVPGPMHGAALLASTAAMRAGAGYVLLLDGGEGPPHALVRRAWSPEALADPRIGAVLVGNGLGRDDEARRRVAAVLATDWPLVIDGDALRLVSPEELAALRRAVILTPHQGEFQALFGDLPGSKIDRARDAARRSGVVVAYKGADTVIAAPDGRVALAGDASDWLSTAGSGDVLAGTTAAMLAGGVDPFDAACAAVWLNGEAARACGAAFIADDLAYALTAARASL
ncbi:NAD(P)H-hydrate dehydratase [uncultured Sphingomonas sp.]|uniref:NAD(P)H-hydrate dehydratase n=1 Tax=uncultured Sphingomonas sp. TaxID=158754 RepID=UPI0035CA4F73